MRNFRAFPGLPATLSDKPVVKRQPVRGYHPGRKKHVVIPDHVVAGIKWLDAEGFPPRIIARFYPGLTRSYYTQVTQGICRLDVEPAPPIFIDAQGWKNRYRWPSSTVED